MLDRYHGKRELARTLRTPRGSLAGEEYSFLLDAKSARVTFVNAIEATGIVDADHQLRLDEPLPITGPSRVRVIILIPERSEVSEAEWAKVANTSPSFGFLRDPGEDVYTLNDGKPFNAQR